MPPYVSKEEIQQAIKGLEESNNNDTIRPSQKSQNNTWIKYYKQQLKK